MERNHDLTYRVEKYAKKIGIDIIGFASPELFTRYLKKHRPDTYLKEAKTVIIIGLHLYDITLDAWNNYPSNKKSFQFADSILARFCYKIANFLLENNYNSVVVSYAPGLYLKDASVLAGIGPIGKNNLLITPQYGPQVRLRAIVTAAPLICGNPVTENEYCENCDMCIQSCPANALSNGEYQKEACYEYSTSNFKNLSKYTVIWCNECIESCPVGKFSE